MMDLVNRRALGLPVGFWFVVASVLALAAASTLGLSDGATFGLVMALTVLVMVFWGLPDSTRRAR
jgi:hypothetical protein